eukprot:g62515.t1
MGLDAGTCVRLASREDGTCHATQLTPAALNLIKFEVTQSEALMSCQDHIEGGYDRGSTGKSDCLCVGGPITVDELNRGAQSGSLQPHSAFRITIQTDPLDWSDNNSSEFRNLEATAGLVRRPQLISEAESLIIKLGNTSN